jgi:Putative MetA-pathway of phenol degradation
MTNRFSLSFMAAASLAALTTSMLVAAPVRADEPKIDKRGYWLFNPTPDGALRDFAADRPAKSYGPTTIDAGRIQLETELYNYSHSKVDGIRTQTHIGPNPTVRVGLTKDLELQVNYTPFVRQRTTDTTVTPNLTENASGSSDTFLRLKYNIIGNDDGSKIQIGLIPYVKFGTAPESLGGNKATEGGFIAAYAFSLPNDWSLTVNTEWDSLKNATNSTFHSQLQQTIGVSKAIAKDLTWTAEFWGLAKYDPTLVKGLRQYSFDTALAWAARKDLQLDVGANFGLNSQTPALQVYTGITRRF